MKTKAASTDFDGVQCTPSSSAGASAYRVSGEAAHTQDELPRDGQRSVGPPRRARVGDDARRKVPARPRRNSTRFAFRMEEIGGTRQGEVDGAWEPPAAAVAVVVVPVALDAPSHGFAALAQPPLDPIIT